MKHSCFLKIILNKDLFAFLSLRNYYYHISIRISFDLQIASMQTELHTRLTHSLKLRRPQNTLKGNLPLITYHGMPYEI